MGLSAADLKVFLAELKELHPGFSHDYIHEHDGGPSRLPRVALGAVEVPDPSERAPCGAEEG